MTVHWAIFFFNSLRPKKITIIGSDNGLSPGRRQAIIWTNDGILLIGPLGTNFSEIVIEILQFSFKKMHFKVSSAKGRPFCPGLNVLNKCYLPFLSQAMIYTWFINNTTLLRQNYIMGIFINISFLSGNCSTQVIFRYVRTISVGITMCSWTVIFS